MATYGLVLEGNIIRTADFDPDLNPVPILSPNKGIWLPITNNPPEYDNYYQTISNTISITDTEITYVYSIDDKSLDEMKIERRYELSILRAGKTYSSLLFNGILLDLSPEVLLLMIGACTAANIKLTSQANYIYLPKQMK